MFIQGKGQPKASQSTIITGNTIPRRKKGRPMKRASELAARTKVKGQHADSTNQVDERPPSKSAIERLPPEIVQQIFLESLEVNLVKTSAQLHEALSRESIYKVLILFAFFDDDEEFPVEEKHFQPAVYRSLDRVERAQLQAKILPCKWFTIDLFRACLPILSRLRMVQEWHNQKYWLGIMSQPEEAKNYADVLSILLPLPDIHDKSAMAEHFLALYEDGTDEEDEPMSEGPLPPKRGEFRCCVDVVRFSDDSSPGGIDAARTKRPIAHIRIIPDWLIAGSPWDAKKRYLLHFLLQSSLIEYDDPPKLIWASKKALTQGITNAVDDKDPEILLALLGLRSRARDKDVFGDNLADMLRRSIHSDFMRNSIQLCDTPIPLSIFHLALGKESLSTTLLSSLIRASVESIPSEDKRLTKWALKSQSQGDPLGKWMLKLMETKSHRGWTDSDHMLFSLGGYPSRLSTLNQIPFPGERNSFFGQLNYCVPDI